MLLKCIFGAIDCDLKFFMIFSFRFKGSPSMACLYFALIYLFSATVSPGPSPFIDSSDSLFKEDANACIKNDDFLEARLLLWDVLFS